MGIISYPNAAGPFIATNCEGSNGYRVCLWKVAMQALANETGLRILVCRFTPGTGKWNKIEHRMFFYISMNWRGSPKIGNEVMVNLIGTTTTKTGLTITAELDTRAHPKGVKAADEELEKVNLTKASFHCEWNYRIAQYRSS